VTSRALVLGAGVFGLEAALALRTRGWAVRVLDRGPIPHPLAASTDVSKAVRMDYGDDDGYADAMLRALEAWREREARWGGGLFHETGVTYLARTEMARGGFEYESWTRLRARGVAAERLDATEIHRRFPAWREGSLVDGYFNPVGGWVDSGALIARLARRAVDRGVELRTESSFSALLEQGGRVTGARADDGETHEADVTVCALGAWAPFALPWLAPRVKATGHPVFLLRPDDATRGLFLPERFPTFGADLSRTGWYGFPLHPREGVVKVANHGAGRAMHPESSDRAVTVTERDALRRFLREHLPALAEAEIVRTRVCLYADTEDGHFWIDRDAEREGLVVATGDSGHALKFAPLLGDWIADACESRAPALDGRFTARGTAARRGESARFHGSL
jgi:glycine/D-amino acid oxidase-like deaminating enzyme